MRIAIAGVGVMGQLHLKNCLGHPGAKIVALADLDADRRLGRLTTSEGNLNLLSSQAMELGQIQSFDDYRPLCRADGIDAVWVCLPTDLHADASILALQNGKHVFCEKPMALTTKDGRRMLQAARRNERKLMIGHVLRFWPTYVAAGQIIQSGRHGKAIAASFTRCGGWMGRWFTDFPRSGGVPMDLHIHDADTCVWWWGKPASIDASAVFHNGCPSILHSRWQYPGGPAVTFESSWECIKPVPFFYSFKVTMQKATLLFDSRNDQGLVLADENGRTKIELDSASGYEIEDSYFLDSAASGRPLDRCPPESSLITLECMGKTLKQVCRRSSRPLPDTLG